jgi:hypothetical protein
LELFQYVPFDRKPQIIRERLQAFLFRLLFLVRLKGTGTLFRETMALFLFFCLREHELEPSKNPSAKKPAFSDACRR